MATVGSLVSALAVLPLVATARPELVLITITVCVTFALMCRTVIWIRLIGACRNAEELGAVISGPSLLWGAAGSARKAMEGPRPPSRASLSDHRQEDTAMTTFWGALTQAEQEVLQSIGTQQTFLRGATLIQEGEPGHHVIIIRSGWTRVCVHENGQERVLAERGPGQLVGERAMLSVSPRSATVIALDTVDALILETPVFAGFVSAHPHVLRIVEDQVYGRLTEVPGLVGASRGSGAPAPATWQGDQPADLDGHNCTVVSTDIVGFGDPGRTAADRDYVINRSRTMTIEAFERAGISWAACRHSDRGDGLLIVVPPRIPTTKVLVALALLSAALTEHGHRSTRPVRIELRAAIHVGPVSTVGDLLRGDSLIHVARMVEAPILRTSMARTSAILGVLASAYVYDNFIKPFNLDGYSKVHCRVKESSFNAWMRLTAPALSSGDR